MTRFEQRLAALRQYVNVAEPKIAPQVNEVIDKYYSGRVGFGDAGLTTWPDGTITQDTPLDPGTTSASVSPTQAQAANDTANILDTLANAGANFLNDQVTMAQQTRLLQLEAQTQAAKAYGVQGTTNTAMMFAAGIGAIAVVALVFGGGRGRR